MQLNKYGISPITVDSQSALLTANGVSNFVSIAASDHSTDGFITYNDFTLQSSYTGFLLLVTNADGSIYSQGNYTSADIIASELTNNVIPYNDKLFFIASIGGCNSSDSLDNIMTNIFNSTHWKSKEIYSNMIETMHYCGIFHSEYGTIKEVLSLIEPDIIYAQYNTAESLISSGYGTYVLIAPDNYGNDSFNGTPRANNVIVNATAVLTSNTTGDINIIFKQDNTTLSTETLTINSLTDMYSDVEKYLAVPANTNNITYSTDSNVEIIGLIVRWSGDVTANVITGVNFGRSGISDTNIVQNNIPTSLMNKAQYDLFYKNNNQYINPTKSDDTVSVLTASQTESFDITGALSVHVTGSSITGFESLVLYFCCWVKGEVDLILQSSDNVFYNPTDFSVTSNDTIIAKSNNTGKWELIEGFIFPEHFTEEKCTEYLTYFKENCLPNVSCNQTIISQIPGDFYFGGTVTSNTQNITISIEAVTESSVYGPILNTSKTMGFNKDGTLSVVNL